MTSLERSPWSARIHSAGPTLLVIAVLARLALTYLVPNGQNFVDLHVYVDGAAALRSGHLYDFTFAEYTPNFPLPFTYPPFAALVFYPLHFLPFGLVALLWELATIAALYGCFRLAGALLPGNGLSARTAMAWTAVFLWSEPMRTNVDYGQVNVFLMLAVLYAAYTTRSVVSGTLAGLAAGVKLTPAIAGVYFVAVGRYRAAIATGVAFLVSITVSYAVIGDQARHYFTDLLGDPRRIGPVGSVFNQSLRGMLARIAGHDVSTAVVAVALAAVSVVGVIAWWRIRGDVLGVLVLAELWALLASPISWTHHWVWTAPMLIWLFYGSLGQYRAGRVLAWLWTASLMAGVPWLLGFIRTDTHQMSNPWWFSALASCNVVGAVAVMVLAASRGSRLSALPAAHPGR